MGSHAKLSPSSAARWMRCPGSVVLEEGKEDKTSVHAAEGTAAHFLAEKCLRSGLDAIEFQGRRIIVRDDGTVNFAEDDDGR